MFTRKMVKVASVCLAACVVGNGGVAVAEDRGETVWAEDATREAMDNISDEDLAFMEKVVSVRDHYESRDDGTVSIDLSDDQLKADYGFDEGDIRHLHGVLSLDPQTLSHGEDRRTIATTYDHRIGHISNYDLKVGAAATLVTAAEGGPAALEAAFIAWATLEGGPIGTAVSAAVGLLGVGFFVDLATKITLAVATGRGLTFYGHAGFPPLVVEVEDD